MSQQAILWDSHNAISSPESADGATPCASPDGPMIDPCGPDPARANLSAQREKVRDSQTLGTCGPLCSGSSASCALALFLANKLRQQLTGSILYQQTWKQKTTPSGRWYWAHIASALPISDSASTGWPTPNASNVKGAYTDVGLIEKRKTAGRQQNLQDVAQLAAWATPCQRDYRCANLKPFSERGGGKKGEQLNNQVVHQVSGQMPSGSTAETVKKGQLNPAFSLWLMGFPVAEWENCAPQVTPSSRKLRKK